MLNSVTLIGYTGKDPVIKNFDSNTIAEFSLATAEKWKNKEGEWQEKTHWHNIKLNNKYHVQTAEKYLTKGKLVMIQGKLTYRTYEDKDGVTRYITQIIASDFKILEKKDKSAEPEYEQPTPAAFDGTRDPATIEDDLPF